jgi:Ca2+-binding EF-hand superfamily protein
MGLDYSTENKNDWAWALHGAWQGPHSSWGVGGMKKKLYGVLALAALAGIVLMLPGLGVGQQVPGGKGGKAKGKGGGGFQVPDFGGGKGGMQFMQGAGNMQMDPNKIFDMMAQGNDYIDINTMRMGKNQAMQWAQDNGITNGQLNRDQFEQYMNSQMARMQGGGPGGPRGNGGPMTPEQVDEQAERLFKLADKNQDGYLTEDEMSGSLRQVWQKWDFDNDGLINIEEYKAYFRDLQAKRQAGNDGKIDLTGEADWEKRPTVYRYGHLPPQLPGWFSQYDTDKDGQVGLYEWRAAGQPFDRFQEMDRNGDGLLTVEEVLYFMKLHPEVYGPVLSESEIATGPNGGWQQWQPPQQQQKGKGFGGGGGKGGPPGGFNNSGQQQPFMAANPRGQGGPGGNPGFGKGKGKGNFDPNDPNSGNFGKKGKGNKGGGGGGPGGD